MGRGRGGGIGGEMAQTMYTHMNKQIKMCLTLLLVTLMFSYKRNSVSSFHLIWQF
jgi:hypothetical protein